MIALLDRKRNSAYARYRFPSIRATTWWQFFYIQRKYLLRVSFYLLIGMAVLQTSLLLAADIGHLFTTPEQRAALQKLRDDATKQKIGARQKEQDIATPETTVSEPKPVDAVYLRGIVYRADGRHKIWISDGNTLAELPQMEDYIDKVEPDRLYLSWPNQTSRQIKVGEYLDLQADKD